MTIGWYLTVQLGIIDNSKQQVLTRDNMVLPTKETSNFLVQPNLTKLDMHKVVIQTADPDSKTLSIEIMVKIIDSTYSKVDRK